VCEVHTEVRVKECAGVGHAGAVQRACREGDQAYFEAYLADLT
jgi:hypothetical protein